MRTLPASLVRTLHRLAVLALAATVVVGIPEAAHAITGQPCYGASCVGKSPTLSNSNGNCANGAYNPNTGGWAESAYDVVTIGLAGYDSSVTLRYSPYCAANWARWNGGTNINYWVETKDGRRASGYGGVVPNYTTMVDGTQLARVCLFSGFDDTQNCSGWY